MNSDEIAALAAGLGKALADGLIASEVAREARAVAAKRERASLTATALNAIGDYCSKARRAVLESLKNDPRTPRSIKCL